MFGFRPGRRVKVFGPPFFCRSAHVRSIRLSKDPPMLSFPKRSGRSTSHTAEAMERLLKSQEAIGIIAPEARRHALAELAQRRLDLLRQVCSTPWFMACWCEGEKFPPRAETTPMVGCECEACQRRGTLWPEHYMSGPRTSTASIHHRHTLSYECYLESLTDWEAAQLPSSPSGLAFRAVREGRIRLRRQRTRLA